MEFVDYKCLESLLIEGEDMIATEGVSQIIGNIIKSFKRACLNAFSVIKNILLKIKHKITSKYTQEDVDNINKSHQKEMTDRHNKEIENLKNNSNNKYKRASSALISSALSIGERYLDVLSNAVFDHEQTIRTNVKQLHETIFVRMKRFNENADKFNFDFRQAIENIPDDIILNIDEKTVILNKIDKNLKIIDGYQKSIKTFNDEASDSNYIKYLEGFAEDKDTVKYFINASNSISNQLMKCEKLYMDLNTKVSKALS